MTYTWKRVRHEHNITHVSKQINPSPGLEPYWLICRGQYGLAVVLTALRPSPNGTPPAIVVVLACVVYTTWTICVLPEHPSPDSSSMMETHRVRRVRPRSVYDLIARALSAGGKLPRRAGAVRPI